MKLLGWMHRKFRQNNSCETPKDHFSSGFMTGQSYMDDLQCHNSGAIHKPFSKSQRDHHHHHHHCRRNSFTSLESARDEQHEDHNLRRELVEQASSEDDSLSELFHGFLAIGTLGCTADMNNEYPSTPTFSMDDHIAEKQTQEPITETELKLIINDELEKVLINGGEGDNASSGRNSHVSISTAGRISHCSSITLSGKPSSEDQIADGAIVCPLQNYLLGSAAAVQSPAAAVKKEQRTSLGELFQKTKQAEENSGAKSEREKSAVHVVKKLLKKRIVHAIDSETKLHKILQIFNRKVHPEKYSSANCEESCDNYKGTKITDHEVKNNNNSGSIRRRSSAEDIIIYPDQFSKENTWSCKTHSHNWPQIMRSGGGGDGGGNEFWVKTDSDYLVLEL